MGVSTDGILCYGFRLKGDEGEELEDCPPSWLRTDEDEDDDPDYEGPTSMEFEDFLANLVGLKEPDGDFDKERYEKDARYRKVQEDYWHRKQGLEKELGVTLVMHCKDDYLMYILAAEGSVKTANRGYPVELGQQVTASSEWREKLRTFCERANIPFEEPQFLLCSYWG